MTGVCESRDAVEPTPFQRDLSDAYHKRLAYVINKTGRFLDPIIVVTAPGNGFWTPNGRHRLEAMRRLGAKSITALVVADREVAWQILALNTEKAHNLKERALEVIRIYRGLFGGRRIAEGVPVFFLSGRSRPGHARGLLRTCASLRWRGVSPDITSAGQFHR